MEGEFQPSLRNVFIEVYVNAIDKCGVTHSAIPSMLVVSERLLTP
jgi:hypothetical protein